MYFHHHTIIVYCYTANINFIFMNLIILNIFLHNYSLIYYNGTTHHTFLYNVTYRFYVPFDQKCNEKKRINKTQNFSLINFFFTFVQKYGSVVQLYRTSDSGSESQGLESLRGHREKRPDREHSTGLLLYI